MLEDAEHKARVLKTVLDRRPKAVIINGERYPEVEDWATLGAFYGWVGRSAEPRQIEPGVFIAQGEIWHPATNRLISTASAYCGDISDPWMYDKQGQLLDKPMFQRASMAQTRAIAKAWRNCLSHVLVLAGLRTTPAEEMTQDSQGASTEQQETVDFNCPTCGGSLRTGISRTNNQRWYRCDTCDKFVNPPRSPRLPRSRTRPDKEGMPLESTDSAQPGDDVLILTTEEVSRLIARAEELGIPTNELGAMAHDKYEKRIDQLTREEATALFTVLSAQVEQPEEVPAK
jgi:predicted RNA-binding Zn-ribbon protein involved in translation (DUF1610 family)